MTRKQAWRLIGKAYEVDMAGISRLGLCGSLSDLRFYGGITDKEFADCWYGLITFKHAVGIRGAYWISLTEENDGVRAMFAYLLAEMSDKDYREVMRND